MTDQLHAHKTPSGYELRHDEQLIGALIWTPHATGDRSVPGWWLEVPGRRPELISGVPSQLTGDLNAARAATESASLGFAELIVGDALAGLLDPA